MHLVSAAVDDSRHGTGFPGFLPEANVSALGHCVELTEDNKGGVQFRKTNYTFAEVGSK